MNLTILLLISDPLVRTVVKETLERHGYFVQSTGDIGTAVDRLKEGTPDLLITGTYVSEISGHDAAKYLRTKCPGLRVLIVGGFMEDDRLRVREEIAGFDVFPDRYSAADLIAKVKEVLESGRG
jgi:CheY-like chemotaxis protein